ncbi:hypothetical protein [Nautilia sp.]
MNNFLKFHMEDRKEDIKKKWKILDYLENDNLINERAVAIKRKDFGLKKEVIAGSSKYSISRLKKIFGVK